MKTMTHLLKILLQGVGFARMSQLCREGELIERCYGDVGTMLEAFQRGARVSGMCAFFQVYKNIELFSNSYLQIQEKII